MVFVLLSRANPVFELSVFLPLEPSFLWWLLVLITISVVLAAELFNTALEFVIDRLHPEQHPAIAMAKDCAAGAVLVLSFASLGLVGALLWDWFMGS